MKVKTFRIGGVHPDENKLSNDKVTVAAELPKQAIFPLSQHIGAPAKPVVAKGDKVKVGTLLAEAGGFVSAPIYSSVSGTVFKIDEAIDATGYRKPVIIVKVEGDEWEETIDRSDKLEKLEDARLWKHRKLRSEVHLPVDSCSILASIRHPCSFEQEQAGQEETWMHFLLFQAAVHFFDMECTPSSRFH